MQSVHIVQRGQCPQGSGQLRGGGHSSQTAQRRWNVKRRPVGVLGGMPANPFFPFPSLPLSSLTPWGQDG